MKENVQKIINQGDEKKDKENAKKEEYVALRQEILSRDAQYNEYRKNIPAITSAVLAFALTQKEPFICLLPIVIIIPMYLISENCLRGIYKIGAYLRVYYDSAGYCWEKRNMEFSTQLANFDSKGDYLKDKQYMELVSIFKRKHRRGFIFLNTVSIYFALVIICGVLCFYKVLTQGFVLKEFIIRSIIIVLVTLISLIIISANKVYGMETREAYKKIWEKIKSGEDL